MDLKEAGERYIAEHPKVFCDQCKFYREIDPKIPTNKNRCHNSKICEHRVWRNATPITEGYWQEWWASGECMHINRYNDCKLFKYERKYADKG